MEGVSSTMKYCKNFCKCHNVPPVQYNLKKLKRIEKLFIVLIFVCLDKRHFAGGVVTISGTIN
jgi:hypothetical protein